MKKQSIIALTRAVIALVFVVAIWSPVSVLAQTEYKFLQLPIGSEEAVFNLGVFHYLKIEETAYKDTAFVNFFFRKLVKSVDPNKVVLVTESFIWKGYEGKIQTDFSAWITPEMRQMGFTKWIAADRRPRDPEYDAKYDDASRNIYDFTTEYYTFRQDTSKLNDFGLPDVLVEQTKEIPDSAAQALMPYLFTIAEGQDFEANIKIICLLLKKQGYIPVVVAGTTHILALNEPCLVQVQPLDKVGDASLRISEYLYFIKADDLILKSLQE